MRVPFLSRANRYIYFNWASIISFTFAHRNNSIVVWEYFTLQAVKPAIHSHDSVIHSLVFLDGGNTVAEDFSSSCIH